MGASRKFGPETIASRFYLMPLSGRLRIALSAVAVLVLGCGVTSDSSPVAPAAARAEVFTDPPLPRHALVLIGAFGGGSMAIVTGEPAMAFAQSLCGFQFVFAQRIDVLPSPPIDRGEVGFRPPLVLTTAVIPPGVFPITLVAYCSPYYLFDVDFSHP